MESFQLILTEELSKLEGKVCMKNYDQQKNNYLIVIYYFRGTLSNCYEGYKFGAKPLQTKMAKMKKITLGMKPKTTIKIKRPRPGIKNIMIK